MNRLEWLTDNLDPQLVPVVVAEAMKEAMKLESVRRILFHPW